MESIYGEYAGVLDYLAGNLEYRIKKYSEDFYQKRGFKLYEHLNVRIKTDESMREKCRRKGLEETPYSALAELHDSLGIRIVCAFIDDIYENIRQIKGFPDVEVVQEKDYIKHAKPNGYRSYHLILKVEVPYDDVRGDNPGHFYVEVQLRTIAMDSWASLEHQLKYKKDVGNQQIIVGELKRVADELASCDISMQTIRELIHDQEVYET